LVFLSRCHLCCTVIHHEFIHIHTCCLIDGLVFVSVKSLLSPTRVVILSSRLCGTHDPYLPASQYILTEFSPLDLVCGTSHIENIFSNNCSAFVYVTVVMRMCLPSHCLAMDVFSGSIIPGFRQHVTVSSLISSLRLRRL
jgi:hypothetical protein